MRPAIDLDFVRAQFPAFAEPSLAAWAHFDNAGGSYPARATVERLTRFYTETKLQPFGPSAPSAKGGAEMDAARSRLAAYLNVAPDELSLGPSTTQNAYCLAHAFRAGWSEGDEIIVTDQDHEANSGAWRRLAETGIIVREWSADPETGRLALADLDRLLTRNTRLVAVTQCSNIVADPNPVAAIAERVHAAGASLVIDGVSAAPHGLPDLEALGADVYLFSLYKTFGPHQGAMVVRRETMARLANQAHYFNDDKPWKRLVPAGPDHAQEAAAGGVADYLDALHAHHFENEAEPAERGRRTARLMRDAEAERLAPLLDFLRDRSDLRILGPDDAATRAPTVALDTRKEPEALAEALAARGQIAGSGHFYAPRLLERMGVDPERGVLRLSFVHYTSPAEIDALIAALDAEL